MHLVGQILAVIWIAISLWMGWVNFFILSILLIGVGEQGDRPLSVRDELAIVLFFLISATVVGTWAFDSPGNIRRNIEYAVVLLATYILGLLAFRIFAARRGS